MADLSFEVHAGEIVGLVGANGAGKTTSLRAITGILRPGAGCVRVGGHDIQANAIEAKKAFAYIPDTVHPYELLTVTEHLHFIALAYRVQDAGKKYAGLLEEFELSAKARSPSQVAMLLAARSAARFTGSSARWA